MLKGEGIGKGEAVLKLTPELRAELENRAFNSGIHAALYILESECADAPTIRARLLGLLKPVAD